MPSWTHTVMQKVIDWKMKKKQKTKVYNLGILWIQDKLEGLQSFDYFLLVTAENNDRLKYSL